ncbi:MAG: signal peptidase II [Pseudomonadota bacterium]
MTKLMAWAQGAWGSALFRRGILLALVMIVLDQATKLFIVHGIALPERPFGKIEISGIFDLTYTENRGVSFGLFAGGMTSRVLLSALSLVVSAFIVRWLSTIVRPLTALGAGLILGGALGNLIDRVAYGYVVDFLDFSGLHFPYIFNVADAAISVGVAFLLYDTLILERREGVKERKDPEGFSDNASQASPEPTQEGP